MFHLRNLFIYFANFFIPFTFLRFSRYISSIRWGAGGIVFFFFFFFVKYFLCTMIMWVRIWIWIWEYLNFRRKVLRLEGIFFYIHMSLFYFTGAHLLKRVCYAICGASVGFAFGERWTCSTLARQTRKKHQIWMAMSWLIDARVHKACEADSKVELRTLPSLVCVSVRERMGRRKNPFCIYATLNFSHFRLAYGSDALHYVLLILSIDFVPYEHTNNFFSACARSLTPCYRCFRTKVWCAIFALFVFGLQFYFRLYIFDARQRKEIKSSAPAYAPEAHGIGIVDIHLIFRTRWIFHSISFHFMSFNIIMWCWLLCVRLDSILMNSLSCSQRALCTFDYITSNRGRTACVYVLVGGDGAA